MYISATIQESSSVLVMFESLQISGVLRLLGIYPLIMHAREVSASYQSEDICYSIFKF